MAHSATVGFSRGGSISYRDLVDALAERVPDAQPVLLTILPRGGIQVIQPQRVSEPMLKAFGREWQSEDDAAWKAILGGAPVRGKVDGRYVSTFLHPFGIGHVVAFPVASPVFEGYAGALELHRSAEAGTFTTSEINDIQKLVHNYEASLAESRSGKNGKTNSHGWQAKPAGRVFVIDSGGDVLLNAESFAELDEQLQHKMVQEAKKRSAHPTGEFVNVERLQLPDVAGDLWTFNAATYRSYPAITDGPVVFFCMMPTAADWLALRATDFHADPEIARLLPSLKYMHGEYRRGPTLTDIAKTVHLSPFHFHRRFTELLGLTPKHFLLECQITDAKNHLVAGDRELAKIAKDCGFAHQSHFTSRFKQATGLTPTRWRRMAYDRQGD